MVSYESYIKTITTVTTAINEGMVSHIGRKLFENKYGYPPEQKLPDKSVDFSFLHTGFSGDIIASETEVRNIMWNQQSITSTRVGSTPELFTEMIPDLFGLYKSVLGDWNTMSHQPDHPGAPPISEDNLVHIFEQIVSQAQILRSTPTLSDLVNAIEDQNYIIAAMFFNIDPQDFHSPGQGSELSGLFTNGEINILYQDAEIALLKPNYRHDITLEVLEDRLGSQFSVAFSETPAEEAYVVGIDDTPTGLFGHTIDGTELDISQTVTKQQIQDVMGFDRSWEYNSNTLNPHENERIRLQGDLGLEYTSINPLDSTHESANSKRRSQSRINIPIDNHLCLFTGNIELPSQEDTTEEPVYIRLHSQSLLNVIHDEHREFAAELPSGKYKLYLLPRGIQSANDRPQWSESQEIPVS